MPIEKAVVTPLLHSTSPLLNPCCSIMALATTSASLPLTTVFTPPASCFTDIAWYQQVSQGGSATVGPLAGCPQCWLGLSDEPSCMPPGWDVNAVFSPGVCPQGYSVACASVHMSGTRLETVGTCCPRSVDVVYRRKRTIVTCLNPAVSCARQAIGHGSPPSPVPPRMPTVTLALSHSQSVVTRMT
jgi:hypothetical protein